MKNWQFFIISALLCIIAYYVSGKELGPLVCAYVSFIGAIITILLGRE